MPQDKRKRILIVEDDPMLSRALTSTLEREGFAVTVVGDGDQALNAAKADAPALILLDLLLPNVSGFDALSNLKLDSSVRDIPVLVLSNLGRPEDIKRVKDLGAAGYLVKPDVSLKTVADEIRKILGKTKAGLEK